MKFGCSECLCIAIESHRPALLKSLLQQTDIEYRDLFWAPTPREWAYPKSTFTRVDVPLLHYFGVESDLSFVGREDCGHMRVDVDLLTHFDVLWNPRNTHILVSLPLMARWHSRKRFNAERILRQSGNFDYSTPQFFHVCDVWRERDALKEFGPLHSVTQLVLRCEFENQLAPYMVPEHLPHSSYDYLFQQRSCLPHGMLSEPNYLLLDQLWLAL